MDEWHRYVERVCQDTEVAREDSEKVSSDDQHSDLFSYFPGQDQLHRWLDCNIVLVILHILLGLEKSCV